MSTPSELVQQYFQDFRDRGGIEHLQQRWPQFSQTDFDELQSVTEKILTHFSEICAVNSTESPEQFYNQVSREENLVLNNIHEKNHCNYFMPALYIPLTAMATYSAFIDPSPENIAGLAAWGIMTLILLYCSYSNTKRVQIAGYDSLIEDIGVPSLAPVYQEMGAFMSLDSTSL